MNQKAKDSHRSKTTTISSQIIYTINPTLVCSENNGKIKPAKVKETYILLSGINF